MRDFIKQGIFFVLIIVLFTSSVFAQVSTSSPTTPVLSMVEGYRAGKLAAEGIKTTGDFAGGFLCGIFIGFGGAIVVSFTVEGDVVPITLLYTCEGKGSDYLWGFAAGYRERTEERRRNTGMFGGLLGAVLRAFLLQRGGNSEILFGG